MQQRWWIRAWVAFLAVLVLGRALGPGFVLSYDMVWVPDPSLTRLDLWGLGSALPRSVPSDALVAALGTVAGAQVVQKAALVGALLAAGLGGARLARERGAVAQFAAATVLVWNPFVAERLAMGHWPLLIAQAGVVWLIVAVCEGRLAVGIVALAATAMTPASGLMGAVTVTVTCLVARRARETVRWLLLAVAINAPWVVAGVMAPASGLSDAAGVEVFASRGAGSTPVWLEVATLGGIWNSDVVPASRLGPVATVLAVAVVGLAVTGLVRVRDEALTCVVACLWVVGFVVAVLGVVVPEVMVRFVDSVPGTGLLRDGSRWVALMAPALAVGLASAVETMARHRLAIAAWVVALTLPVAVVPDLGWGLSGKLRATHYPAAWDQISQEVSASHVPGALLSLPFSAFRAPEWNFGRPVLDPAGRYFDRVTVTQSDLRVGDVVVAGEDQRAARISEALREGDWADVADNGIGLVVVDHSAPGAEEARAQVAELRTIAASGELSLHEVPNASAEEVSSMRIAVVTAAWVLAALTLLVALIRWAVGGRSSVGDDARRP